MKALQIPVTLYIHANVSRFAEQKITVLTADMSEFPEYVLLETRQIIIDVDQPEPIDLIGKQVETLRAQKERIAASSHQQQILIDDQIQQLLCIEHSEIDVHELPY